MTYRTQKLLISKQNKAGDHKCPVCKKTKSINEKICLMCSIEKEIRDKLMQIEM